MIDFLIAHQEEIMMVLSGMCGVIAIFVLLMKSLPKKRRHALLAVEICAMFIMIADCLAYAYRGELTETAYYVVRISNFVVFSLVWISQVKTSLL